jgi:hypothetical protein
MGLLAPRPTANLDQASELMSPGDRVAQLYLQALGFPFSRLLRHAGVRWGYSSLIIILFQTIVSFSLPIRINLQLAYLKYW